MRNNVIRNTILHIVQGFLSRKKLVRYNTRNIAWLYINAGLSGFGIRRTGINHWRQYIIIMPNSFSYFIVF
jgi:hypothetical protein